VTRTVLIDGDLLLYRFGFRGQTTFDWGENVKSVVTEKDVTIADMNDFIKGLQAKVRCPRAFVVFTGSDVFRYKLLPTYKHNRKKNEKPLLYLVLKEHLMNNYECKVKDKLEADDTLSVIATRHPEGYVIASIDKDFKQIPAWHFNWDKDVKPRFITKREADRWFYQQALTGDPTDGFSGCPGAGPAAAKKMLKKVDAMCDDPEKWESIAWELIVESYAARGLDESYALTQARMARILRAEDYDFENDEIIMWTPTTTS